MVLSHQLSRTTSDDFALCRIDKSQHGNCARSLALIVVMGFVLMCIGQLTSLCTCVWLCDSQLSLPFRGQPFRVLVHECRYNYAFLMLIFMNATTFVIIFSSINFELAIAAWCLYFQPKSRGPDSLICVLVFCRVLMCQDDGQLTKLLKVVVILQNWLSPLWEYEHDAEPHKTNKEQKTNSRKKISPKKLHWASFAVDFVRVIFYSNLKLSTTVGISSRNTFALNSVAREKALFLFIYSTPFFFALLGLILIVWQCFFF